MRTVLLLVVHFLSTLAKLVGSGGARTVVADSLLIKHQLIVINQSRKRAPNLTGLDRFLFGFWSLFMNPKRLFKSNVILKASTFLHFHKILVNRKYHRLFSSRKKAKPGPKGPSMELIRAIVELKQRNTGYGCPRIAQLISTVFGIEIDEIKTVPYVPMSHPFVERLIGTLSHVNQHRNFASFSQKTAPEFTSLILILLFLLFSF